MVTKKFLFFVFYMYGYKSKDKNFPLTDLVKDYCCDQIVAHCAFLRSSHWTQWMFTYHKFDNSEIVFILAIGQYLWNP